MNKLVEAIVEIFQKNIKRPILWLVVIVIISEGVNFLVSGRNQLP